MVLLLFHKKTSRNKTFLCAEINSFPFLNFGSTSNNFLVCLKFNSFLLFEKLLHCVWLFGTPWTVACQVPVSQARILEWVAFPFSRGSSWLRDQTQVSCTDRWVLYHLSLGSPCLWVVRINHINCYVTKSSYLTMIYNLWVSVSKLGH